MKIAEKKAGKFSLPSLGLGTWRMGGKDSPDPNNDDIRDIAAIKYACSKGIYHLDTAERYAGGYAEVLLGKAIPDMDRGQLFLTSKVSPEHLTYDNLIRSAKDSLDRLGTNYLDLYLIHAPSDTVPLKDSMKAMGFLFENGYIRNIGVSNFGVKELEEARSHSKYKIVNNQIHYSLSARLHETEGTLDYCEKHQILITAYRPYGPGMRGGIETNVMKNLVGKYKKSEAQIAINWLIRKPNIVVLFKSSNPSHIDENLEAMDFSLDDDDMTWLDKNFPQSEMVYGPRQ